MHGSAELAPLKLPDFGMPTTEPELNADVYRDRLATLRSRAIEEGYDAIVVYGDREHFANLTYLTGYDPRFEEALLVVPVNGAADQTTLLVGNEGRGYVANSPIQSEIEIALFQSFSLLGQDRSESQSLATLFRESGLCDGMTIGVVGWKHFPEFDQSETTLEIPAYIAETLREVCALVQRSETRMHYSWARMTDYGPSVPSTSSHVLNLPPVIHLRQSGTCCSVSNRE